LVFAECLFTVLVAFEGAKDPGVELCCIEFINESNKYSYNSNKEIRYILMKNQKVI
jgi:hypothetical protein